LFYCGCIVGLALHEIPIGVNEPEGTTNCKAVFSSAVNLPVLHTINFYTALFMGTAGVVSYLVTWFGVDLTALFGI
jgi:hypothetical protein